MKIQFARRLILLAGVSWCSLSTQATIIGGTVSVPIGGAFVKLTPPLANPFGAPNSVGNNTFQNDKTLYGFDEDQNVFVVGSPLSVDELASGLPGTLPVGTEVASHYIFFDPVSGTQTGSVDFDAAILAVITSTGRLAASDYLANTGVNYLNPSARGLESGDSAVIDGTFPYRLDVKWTASTPGDYVRVLTAHSPGAPSVPDAGSTVLMLGAGLAAMGCFRRGFGSNARS